MPELRYYNGKPTPVSMIIRDMELQGVPETYIQKFIDTAEFASGSVEFFDESKINRANDGKFASKGAASGGGKKSADAAVEEGITSKPPLVPKDSKAPVPKDPKSNSLTAKASQSLSKTIDSIDPVKQPTTPQSTGGKILTGLLETGKFAVKGGALVSSEVLRRSLGVMSFFDPFGFANVSAWLGQDPHFDKMQRKYGRTTANLIAASGYVVQAGVAAAAITAIPHAVAAYWPSLPVATVVGKEWVHTFKPGHEDYGFGHLEVHGPRLKKMMDESHKEWKQVGGHLEAGPVIQGMVTAAKASFWLGGVATLLSPKSDETSIFAKVKKVLQKATEYSRFPGEMLAHGAFRGLQKLGVDIEIGPDEEPAPAKKAKFSRNAMFADDKAVTLPMEDIKRLGAEYGEYFRQQYIMRLFEEPKFWIGFAKFLKSEGITPEMLKGLRLRVVD